MAINNDRQLRANRYDSMNYYNRVITVAGMFKEESSSYGSTFIFYIFSLVLEFVIVSSIKVLFVAKLMSYI